MTAEEVKAILDTIYIEQKTATSLTHPPLAMGYGLNNPATIIEFANKIEIAVLAKAILGS